MKQRTIKISLKKRRKNESEPHCEKTYLLPCAPNEEWDQPAHPRSQIRVFVGSMKKLCILGYPKCAQRRFWSDCANAQSDLNLRWAHISAQIDHTLEIGYPLLLTNKNLVHVMKKAPCRRSGHRRHRSACAVARADQGLRSPHTESFAIMYWPTTKFIINSVDSQSVLNHICDMGPNHKCDMGPFLMSWHEIMSWSLVFDQKRKKRKENILCLHVIRYFILRLQCTSICWTSEQALLRFVYSSLGRRWLSIFEGSLYTW